MVPKLVILYASPFFFLLIVWEMYQFRKHQQPFPHADAMVSIVMALVYALVNHPASLLIDKIDHWFYSYRLFDIPSDTAWGLGLLFFAEEFAYYWLHRCGHKIRWFWASHSVHHSPSTITLAGAYRLSFTGPLSGLFLFFLPLFVLGFSPVAVAAMFGINLIYQFWLHTEWLPKLGWFEYIFNTPSHHRVHHATNPEYIDRNYGGILIIFDRLFGTFAEEKSDVPLNYGLLNKEPRYNPVLVLLREWLDMFLDLGRAGTWRERFYFVFGRPGWQPATPALSASANGSKEKQDTQNPYTAA